MALGTLALEGQALLDVDPIGALVVDLPAFTPKQYVEAAIAIPNTNPSQLVQALS
jgi:hypothetical protein